jgi:phosphotransacetylase
MGLLERLKQRARAQPQRIVLPEGEDDRVIKAASRVARERYAKPMLLGRVDFIRASAERLSLKLDGVEILDVAVSPQLERHDTRRGPPVRAKATFFRGTPRGCRRGRWLRRWRSEFDG